MTGRAQDEITPTTARSTAGALALLVGASAGCLAFGLLYLAGDKSKAINHLLSLYTPSGALSGVLAVGTLVWIAAWLTLHTLWSRNPPAVKTAVHLALLLLLGALLFTFPPLVRGL